MLNPEFVTVVANGLSMNAWLTVEVSASIKEAARSFTLTASEIPGEWVFPPDSPVKIFAMGDLLLDGFVDEYEPDINPAAHSVSISGRSRAGDFVDSSATFEPGWAEDQTPKDFAEKLDNFGLGFAIQGPASTVPMQQIAQGESGWETVERYNRQQGGHMMGRADGGIDIVTKAGQGRHAGGLYEGHNIKTGRAKHSRHQRFSDYIVKGQGRDGHGEDRLRIRAEAQDAGVKRYRPKIIIAEGDMDKTRAKKRAEHEKDRRAGEGTRATISVQGWRDDGGTLLQPNFLITTYAPSLKLWQDMLIEKVSYRQDGTSGGSVATLELVDPRAFGGDQAGKSKSDTAWTDF